LTERKYGTQDACQHGHAVVDFFHNDWCLLSA
jgi:hypothetical protein